MTRMEAKLQEIWGVSTLTFCKQCGVPTLFSACGHRDAAPWSALNERQRMQVRRQAMAKAKAQRGLKTVFTAVG
ncbi:MAG: hypothetical protein FWJ73_04310 [Limnochordales bacterium]|nr:hypothetical protein [Bacillota bacterium]